MSRRDRWDEETLAHDDERRDAIDRIHERCKRDGITKASEVVRAIVNGLASEMRPLIEVPLLATLALLLLAAPAHADCGEERAAVKLGTDAGARVIAPLAVDATVAELAARHRPAKTPETSRAKDERGTETHLWRVTGRIVAYKPEADGDYHLVIADDAGNHLIAEIPDPGCAASGAWGKQIAAARSAASRLRPGTKVRRPAAPPLVTLTGPGFFDKIHGQLGVAANGVEIHPVLSIRFRRCPVKVTPETLTDEMIREHKSQLIEGGGSDTCYVDDCRVALEHNQVKQAYPRASGWQCCDAVFQRICDAINARAARKGGAS